MFISRNTGSQYTVREMHEITITLFCILDKSPRQKLAVTLSSSILHVLALRGAIALGNSKDRSPFSWPCWWYGMTWTCSASRYCSIQSKMMLGPFPLPGCHLCILCVWPQSNNWLPHTFLYKRMFWIKRSTRVSDIEFNSVLSDIGKTKNSAIVWSQACTKLKPLIKFTTELKLMQKSSLFDFSQSQLSKEPFLPWFAVRPRKARSPWTKFHPSPRSGTLWKNYYKESSALTLVYILC